MLLCHILFLLRSGSFVTTNFKPNHGAVKLSLTKQPRFWKCAVTIKPLKKDPHFPNHILCKNSNRNIMISTVRRVFASVFSPSDLVKFNTHVFSIAKVHNVGYLSRLEKSSCETDCCKTGSFFFALKFKSTTCIVFAAVLVPKRDRTEETAKCND